MMSGFLGKGKGNDPLGCQGDYRAIYREVGMGKCEIIEVLEVNKHEY